jgi:hypothetical protein
MYELREEGVAWRAADALADPIEKAGRCDPCDRAGEREQWPRRRAETVADDGEQLAPAENVR